jgi:hypothetical protein
MPSHRHLDNLFAKDSVKHEHVPKTTDGITVVHDHKKFVAAAYKPAAKFARKFPDAITHPHIKHIEFTKKT